MSSSKRELCVNYDYFVDSSPTHLDISSSAGICKPNLYFLLISIICCITLPGALPARSATVRYPAFCKSGTHVLSMPMVRSWPMLTQSSMIR